MSALTDGDVQRYGYDVVEDDQEGEDGVECLELLLGQVPRRA